MTLFEALTGGAFDRLNWQHSGEFDQNFSKKSNAPGFARGGMGGFGIDWYIKSRNQLENRSSDGLSVYINKKLATGVTYIPTENKHISVNLIKLSSTLKRIYT